jgi:hypothetical protein
MILNLRGKNTEIYPLICLMDCLFVGQNIIELTSVDSTNSYLTKLTLVFDCQYITSTED